MTAVPVIDPDAFLLVETLGLSHTWQFLGATASSEFRGPSLWCLGDYVLKMNQSQPQARQVPFPISALLANDANLGRGAIRITPGRSQEILCGAQMKLR